MSRLGRWLLGLIILVAGFLRAAPPRERLGGVRLQRIVPGGEPQRRVEAVVIVLLLAAALCGVGFVVVYALDSLGNRTQLFGLLLGGAFAFVAAALIIIGKRLVVTEEIEEDYPPPEHPAEQLELTQIVRESSSRFTRKRLMTGAATTAAGALGLAALTPALSMGPALRTEPLLRTPWRRGRRLVDENGRRYLADDIEPGTFYTAYAEGAPKDDMGSPLVVVRLEPHALKLPPDRSGWAPGGILAYSKICTHAGCAIALYRKPTFAPAQPRPALVCPCHYSTFDPATGGTVLFGPAGRDLPQLPLMVDPGGGLRAAGNFSGPVGPSWWGVRMWRARS
jgi:ubiquinol-cytochrome c reductase iron-sulfur subunit